MKIFYSETHHQHYPRFEIFTGGRVDSNFEVPERAERILNELKKKSWAKIVSPDDFGLEPIINVHDADYIKFLETSFSTWMIATKELSFDTRALLPSIFPTKRWGRRPKSLMGQAGYYMSDLSCPIVAGTYQAALAAANCALSGAREISNTCKENLLHSPASFALCRPPGHHAGIANSMGYCYINNAAVAANWLSRLGKVAVLDIDYHVGNGTQDIFYERNDVFTISIHADPDYEYPYYCGYRDEKGAGTGLGYHRNFPLSIGASDDVYLSAIVEAMKLLKIFSPQYVVLSVGLDIFKGDPIGKFKISQYGINHIGNCLASMNLPTLVVFEGGYNNAELGENMVIFLENFVYHDNNF